MFSTLTNLLAEYRIYRRDEKGKIVKSMDHLMDAMRYLCASLVDVASTQPQARGDIKQMGAADTYVGY